METTIDLTTEYAEVGLTTDAGGFSDLTIETDEHTIVLRLSPQILAAIIEAFNER